MANCTLGATYASKFDADNEYVRLHDLIQIPLTALKKRTFKQHIN